MRISRIQSFYLFYHTALRIAEVDGVRPSGFEDLIATGAEVRPGPHTLSFAYGRCFLPIILVGGACLVMTWERGTLDFVAEPGRSYRLKVDRSCGRLWGWLVDVRTGKIVAGKKPD